MDQVLLSPKQVSEGWRISVITLARFRANGNGPRYIKIGRAVRYHKGDLENWLKQQERRSTSEAA